MFHRNKLILAAAVAEAPLIITTLLATTVVFSCLATSADALHLDGSVGCAAAANEAAAKIELGVYFESKCPDSKRFFLKQLVPAYKQIGNITQLKLVPFGHARVISRTKMICQHGARECEGNRFMACVQVRGGSGRVAEVVDTLGCLFENRLSPKECVNKYLPGVDYDDVERCKGSDESATLMAEFEKMTGRPDYVPMLTIDGKHSADIQDEAEHRLQEYICKLYKGCDKPAACNQQSSETD